MTGFQGYPTHVLETTRARLAAGLDRVAASLDAGTFETPGAKGQAPPSQSGLLTLALLDAIDAELTRRTDAEPNS